MRHKNRLALIGGLASLTVAGAALAQDTETDQQLLERLVAAEARIAELEAENGGNWLTEQRSEEIRGLVHDVLADADTRASLMQSGITAGYDNGAVLASEDGNWLLRTNMLMQQRIIYNVQNGGATDDTNRFGFENTRTRFILSGHVVNPDWFYMVDINVGVGGQGDTNTNLYGQTAGYDRTGVGNAFLGHDYGNGWKVMMGQFKVPLLREELVDSQNQLAVERSNATYGFTGGYTVGLAGHYSNDQYRTTFGLTNGANTDNAVWSTVDTEISLTGRFEYLFRGNWDQFADFTSPPGSETGIMAGIAAHWQRAESGPTASPDTEIFVLTGDLSLEFDGANVFAQLMYANIDPNMSGSSSVGPFGLVLQGGFYVADPWELFLRYEYTDYDTTEEDLSIITVGANRYFAGHNAKWTTDFGFGLNAVESPANITGFRSDANQKDGQFVLRSQVQILF